MNCKQCGNYSGQNDYCYKCNRERQQNYTPRKQRAVKCKNGIFVSSSSEKIIADWLTDQQIEFEYDEVIPFDEADKDYRYDFYLPQYDIYIEFWGLRNQSYRKNRTKKINLYAENNLKLISLEQKDTDNIDCLSYKIKHAKVPTPIIKKDIEENQPKEEKEKITAPNKGCFSTFCILALGALTAIATVIIALI